MKTPWVTTLTMGFALVFVGSVLAQENRSLSYEWNGLYAGGHLGYAWGSSHWKTQEGISGILNLMQPINSFYESGSFFSGIQTGYNHMFPNRFVISAEVDASFPSWPNLSGVSIGGIQTFFSPALSTVLSYRETVLTFGTLRGRVGYAPGICFFYVTGGFAWTYDELSLTPPANQIAASSFLMRTGLSSGAGVEVSIIPHWTAKLEYLLTNYGRSTKIFYNPNQIINSNFLLHELRVGLNYQFDDHSFATVLAKKDWDNVSLHGQTTFNSQGYPQIRSPYEGTNSLPGTGECCRETVDITLYAGLKLWQDAEIWINPEIDQGFGLGNTHGIAGFSSAEAYKLGANFPYTRIQRYFIRQRINLGGKTTDIDADTNQFAGSQTTNALILTAGRYYIIDLFDTNRYANNPKKDFLNWSVINAGSFDYAGDGWGTTYGITAELITKPIILRTGIHDLTVTPSGGANNERSYALDPTFRQFQLIGEIEKVYTLGNQPGTVKVTATLMRGRMGKFQDAVALSQASGIDASEALAAVRTYTSRSGVHVNLAQQITDYVGIFGRIGWADGTLEPFDVTDIDRTVQAGVSIAGNYWCRPKDTFGIAGVINDIFNVHKAYFNAGGLGILIGDGQLPHPGLEQIIETYYSYTLSTSTNLSFDYQYVVNPAYNTDRGPVHVFSGRFHWEF